MKISTASPAGPIAGAVRAIEALLVSIERSPSPAATVAFKAAIRRYGHDVYDQQGRDGFAAVLARIRSNEPAKAEEHEEIVLAAWEGIAR